MLSFENWLQYIQYWSMFEWAPHTQPTHVIQDDPTFVQPVINRTKHAFGIVQNWLDFISSSWYTCIPFHEPDYKVTKTDKGNTQATDLVYRNS